MIHAFTLNIFQVRIPIPSVSDPSYNLLWDHYSTLLFPSLCRGIRRENFTKWVEIFTWLGWDLYMSGLKSFIGLKSFHDWVTIFTWLGWNFYKIGLKSLHGWVEIVTWLGWNLYMIGLKSLHGLVEIFTWLGWNLYMIGLKSLQDWVEIFILKLYPKTRRPQAIPVNMIFFIWFDLGWNLNIIGFKQLKVVISS